MRNRQAVEDLIQTLMSKQIDMLVRSIPYLGGMAYICYIGQLVDRQAISELVIKPLLVHCAESKKDVSAVYAVENLLYADECLLDDDLNRVELYVLNGQTVILFSSDRQFVIVNRKKVEKRNVTEPELMYALRGPRDAFVEDLDTNLSLLRYRIKDGNLRIVKKQVGARTKSTVAVIYIADIANPNVVSEISKMIDGINTDGVFETGELQQYLKQQPDSLFPRMGIIERSDMAVEELLEGKVLVLMDGSNTALHAPKVFAEFLYTCDDRYENKFFGTFMRFLRYAAVFLSISLTSYYIAIGEFHHDVMPASYIVTFAQMRARTFFHVHISAVA